MKKLTLERANELKAAGITQIASIVKSHYDSKYFGKLRQKLERLENLQDIMRETNAYYRKEKTLDGCPCLSLDDIEKIKFIK